MGVVWWGPAVIPLSTSPVALRGTPTGKLAPRTLSALTQFSSELKGEAADDEEPARMRAPPINQCLYVWPLSQAESEPGRVALPAALVADEASRRHCQEDCAGERNREAPGCHLADARLVRMGFRSAGWRGNAAHHASIP